MAYPSPGGNDGDGSTEGGCPMPCPLGAQVGPRVGCRAHRSGSGGGAQTGHAPCSHGRSSVSGNSLGLIQIIGRGGRSGQKREKKLERVAGSEVIEGWG